MKLPQKKSLIGTLSGSMWRRDLFILFSLSRHFFVLCMGVSSREDFVSLFIIVYCSFSCTCQSNASNLKKKYIPDFGNGEYLILFGFDNE